MDPLKCSRPVCFLHHINVPPVARYFDVADCYPRSNKRHRLRKIKPASIHSISTHRSNFDNVDTF
eukprot:764013-Ditylum_brightwellii.AAC.1